jgi:hypothetical protein
MGHTYRCNPQIGPTRTYRHRYDLAFLTDFYTPLSGLRLPTLAIASDRDTITPPDLVRETADLIPGSTFALIRGAGHLPPIKDPAAFANILTAFLIRNGHIHLPNSNNLYGCMSILARQISQLEQKSHEVAKTRPDIHSSHCHA